MTPDFLLGLLLGVLIGLGAGGVYIWRVWQSAFEEWEHRQIGRGH